MNNTTISSSLEDYLEVIAELSNGDGHAHAKDIADHLKVKMPSVTNALRALAERGLVSYSPHSPVILTDEGMHRANRIRNRHSVLEQFFRDVLRLDHESASQAACKIEHVVSNKVISRIVMLTGAIEEREDCAGLRKYLEEEMNSVQSYSSEEIISLDLLRPGQQAVIMELNPALRGKKRFADLGLVPGAVLEFEGYAPFGDLIRLKLLGCSLSLRAGDAMNIWVHPND